MIIDRTEQWSLAASQQYMLSRESEVSATLWRGGGDRPASATSTTLTSRSKLSISEAAWRALQHDMTPTAAAPGAPGAGQATTRAPTAATVAGTPDAAAHGDTAAAIAKASEAADRDPGLQLVQRVVETIIGRRLRHVEADAGSGDAAAAREPSPAAALQNSRPSGSAGDAAALPPGVRGAVVRTRDSVELSEQVGFAAQGIVRTRDGREISFSLQMAMSSSLRLERSTELRIGEQAKDPLVISFDGLAPQLQDQRFRFDLDADGRQDSLPTLASGSGYLVFDRDGNGRIDSGKELFGPATNDGFAELKALDDDGNGWIDEADAAFSKLAIWRGAGTGAAGLTSLADAGIGALSVNGIATAMTLRGQAGQALGALRGSGIALTDGGQALAMQQIDLIVR